MNSKKEKSLNDTYQRWVQTSLYDLPLDGANDFVDNKIMGYGTAIDEKVLSISDYRKLINRQREQAIGLEMNFEITPVFRSISNREDSAIFVDEIKASIVLQVGNQELSLRMTTILEYANNKWIVIHWHGSIPTETLAETDTWLVNEWKRKNEELEKLVDENTFELLNKNRELEIEASLEKVRTIAMGMRKPDDMLDVCKTISLQLQSLGVKEIRNVQTAIFYEQRGTYMNYEYYAKHDKTFITETVYTDSEIHNEFAKNMIKGKGEVSTIHVNGSEVKDWIAYQKTTNVFIDKYLETASSLNYYWFSLGPVALGISTYHPLTETEINLFKRFLKVFELAYQRYLDIEQAETQAREAQIEASLERVRAVAMGMNKSDDLLSICDVSFKEFQKLGFENIRNAIIHIPNDEQKYFMDYDYSESTGGAITKIEYGSHPIVDEYLEKIKSAEDAYFEVVITEDQLAGWKEFRKNSGQVDDIRLDKANALSYYLFSIGIGDIGISTFEPIDESQIKILKRFRNVFDLACQRYTDITQAEAQAREAKTEAALEKVRAIAMSMNKPDDLLNVCEVLFMEFHKLGFGEMRNSMINIHNDEKETFINYDYSDEIGKSINHLTYNIHPVIEKQIKQIRSTNDAFSETSFTGTDLEEWKKFRNKIGEKDDPRINNLSALYYYFYSIGTGSIGISTFSPIGEEKLVLLKRFRNVFSLSYQRYSDIALAEAQAKEAQIEAALERVRSRTMGMQRSDELAETVSVLFKQLLDLGVKSTQLRTCGIVTFKENEPMGEIWITDITGEIISDSFDAPYDEAPAYKTIYSKWKSGEKFLELNLKGDAFLEHLSFVKKYSAVPNINLDEIKKLYNEIFFHVIYFSQGYLFIISYEALTEFHGIFKRFGALFHQTYTRFLDFKKVEAQNKIIQAENDRKTKELEDARQLQLSMLPRELPKVPNLDIAVYMKTATEVGGDYYDFHIQPDGTLNVLVGDATGHGMMSGMMVSIIKSFFIASRNNFELKQFFENSNTSIKDMQLGRLMMACIGVQITHQKVIATNAGMPSLLYFRNKSQKAGEFVSNNLPLGGMKGTKYLIKEIRYEKGDTLLLMSDGLAELKNKNEEQYGYARIINEFKSVVHKSSTEIVEHLKNSASEWAKGTEPDDDVTFVVINVK